VVIFGVSDSGKAVIPRYSINESQDVKFPCHPLSVCPHLWSISAPQASGNEVTTLQTKPCPNQIQHATPGTRIIQTAQHSSFDSRQVRIIASW